MSAARDWSDSTAVILTCDRDAELLKLCLAGVRKFWPGIRVVALHDMDYSKDTELPDDVRACVRRLPYLRKVFDLPHIAPTDQLYCIDSDSFLLSEPADWGPAMHMGLDGYHDHDHGLRVWRDLGCLHMCNSPRFCGGGWSAKRSQMFDPNRELAIRYVRRCMELGLDKGKGAPVVCEQSLLAGLWRMTYPESLLPTERYPLWYRTGETVIYHLGEAREQPEGKAFLAEYRQIVGAA